MRWPATVILVVSVVIRPNTTAGRFQDLAVEDIETEPNQHVEILRPNFFQGIGWKAMNKFLSQGLHLEPFYPGEQTPAIDFGKRVVRCFHSCVEAKIESVKKLLS
jgi:hypothetical protein